MKRKKRKAITETQRNLADKHNGTKTRSKQKIMSYLQTNWHFKTDKIVNLRVQDVAKGWWHSPNWWENGQGKGVK